MRKIIKRSSQPPLHFDRSELLKIINGNYRTKVRKIEIPYNNECVNLTFSASLWRNVSTDRDLESVIRFRNFHAIIEQNDKYIGYICLKQVEKTEPCSLYYLWDEADSESGALEAIIYMLSVSWTERRLNRLLEVPVLELSEAWTAPSAPHGIAFTALRYLVRAARIRHGLAILRLAPHEYLRPDPFPTDPDERKALEKARTHRTNAMRRHYARHLKFETLKNAPGYMWAHYSSKGEWTTQIKLKPDNPKRDLRKEQRTE